MQRNSEDESSESSTADGDETAAEPMYVYTGSQTIADSKVRLAEWLKRRGW